jgi:hypothetical protein
MKNSITKSEFNKINKSNKDGWFVATFRTFKGDKAETYIYNESFDEAWERFHNEDNQCCGVHILEGKVRIVLGSKEGDEVSVAIVREIKRSKFDLIPVKF